MTADTAASGRRYGAKSAPERHRDRHARLLEAGLEQFGTRGYAETAIGQLCAAASVSTRSFYEHFASREELLIALHDEINEEALLAVVAAMGTVDDRDLSARARAGVDAYLRTMTSDRRRARIVLVESVSPSREAERHRRIALQRFAELIELETDRLAAAGVIPVRDHGLIAVAIVGAIHGLVNTWTIDPDWDAHLDDIVTTATHLIVTSVS